MSPEAGQPPTPAGPAAPGGPPGELRPGVPEPAPALGTDAVGSTPGPEGLPGPEPGQPSAAVVGPLTDENQQQLRRHHRAARREVVRRRRRRILAVLGVVALLLIGVVAWYEVEAHPFGGPGAGVIVHISPGESSGSVVDTLASRGVIGSALAFRLGELFHGTPTVRPGDYLFHHNQSFSSVRSILAGGSNIAAVTVVPGYTLSEVAHQLDAVPGHLGEHFVAIAQSGVVRSPWEPVGSNNLEGLLGTGTYEILPGMSDAKLLATMVARFDTQASQAGATPAAAAALGLTPYQLVTVASIVEKEGYTPPSNFGPVARVIYNRLAARMALAMDSTVLYSLGQDGGPVTAADLKINTPYNTYLHTGLTPTPICIPSLAALRAAVDPPPGHWLYFVVVQKNGTEAFSDTFAQQQANEALAKSRGLG